MKFGEWTPIGLVVWLMISGAVSASNHTRSLPPDLQDSPKRNWTSLAEILDVFDTRRLADKWIEGEHPVGERCAKDITRYIEGLRNHETWALKAEDASGRYTSGFFWGNSYFSGSATECAYIGQDYSKGPKKSKNESGERTISRHSGFSGTYLLYENMLDAPPYDLGFYMLIISVNTSVTSTTRIIHLGVCLPFSCTASDVSVIVKLAGSETSARQSSIETIRDQHQLYNVYTDPSFWVLVGVSVLVLTIMIISTGYDLYLSRKYARGKNVIYDLGRHAKLEQLANGNGKVLNGKIAARLQVCIPGNRTKMTNTHRLSQDKDGSGATEVIIHGTQPVNNNNDHECSLRSQNAELQKLSVFEELLLSFSVRANLKIICDDKVGGDTISTIHGLRAISMGWVILGHTCIAIFKFSDNTEYRKVVERKFLFQTISNGAFSVDTFFFMGGLLVSFLFFRTNAKGDLKKLTQGTRGFVSGTLKFIGLLLYRFCRLTAPYMFVLGVVQITMKSYHANSVFEPQTADHENCPKYWWRNLLYINTLFPIEEMCMLWSWYVADDTQFYIVGAVILILATTHFKIAAFALSTLLISSWLTTGYIALVNHHMPNADDPLALFDKIYDKPWTRLGPYLIGMAVGYFLFKTDCKVKMSKTTVVVGWLFSSACLLSLLYGLYETELSPITAAAYSSLSHSVWALGLSWIVIACSTGYGGYVNNILSASILYPFSRVTYCAYLVHPLVIRLTTMNLDSPFHLANSTMLILFLGQLVLSYTLSFIVSLSFEAPAVSMLKILSPKKRKRIQ